MHPIFQLMRLDKPIGLWLLFFPASWAVALASTDFGDVILLEILVLFGAFLTRSAGCVINDLTDQNLDREVERTRTRPLAAGTVTRKEAYALLAMLLFTSFIIVLALPDMVLLLAIIAIPMIAAYPWMKRMTNWPQLFLGATFNLSALMGWAMTGAKLDATALCLYLAGILWTLGYDTIYAVQDMQDDARVGILSSARKLGIHGIKSFVTWCYGGVLALLLLAGLLYGAGIFYYFGVIACAAHARGQINQLPPTPEKAGELFRSNQWFGLFFLVGILLSRMIG